MVEMTFDKAYAPRIGGDDLIPKSTLTRIANRLLKEYKAVDHCADYGIPEEIKAIAEKIKAAEDSDEYGEGYTIIYKELYGFVGTKQEFIDYLWEVHATRITSPYDCTGQHFTTGWKVARVADNLWKVAECVGVDV